MVTKKELREHLTAIQKADLHALSKGLRMSRPRITWKTSKHREMWKKRWQNGGETM